MTVNNCKSVEIYENQLNSNKSMEIGDNLCKSVDVNRNQSVKALKTKVNQLVSMKIIENR